MMIELSNAEARIFRALAEARALDVSSGRVVIHFNADGKPSQVEVIRFTSL